MRYLIGYFKKLPTGLKISHDALLIKAFLWLLTLNGNDIWEPYFPCWPWIVKDITAVDSILHYIFLSEVYFCIIGNLYEKSRSNSKGHYFKVDSKMSYFYQESILYPFAQFAEKKNEFFIENSKYFEITTLLNILEWHPCILLFYIYCSSVHLFWWYLVLYSYNS